LNECLMPSANWLRDDDIGGLRQLNDVFEYLEDNNLVDDAITEKELSVKIWKEIKQMFNDIEIQDEILREFIGNSIEYGLRFFTVIDVCFKIIAKCRKRQNVKDLLMDFDIAWNNYKELEKRNQSSTSYNTDYKFEKDGIGFDEVLKYCQEKLN